MLADIAAAVVKNMAGVAYTPDDRLKLTALILNEGNAPISIIDYERYNALTYYANVLDRTTKMPFKCALLGDDQVYSVATIMRLQALKAQLTALEVADIERLNKCST